MANVMITEQGLDFVMNAHDDGALISIAYFVPVYDNRIDGNVRSSGLTSAFAEIADESLTDPIGEIIWNVSGTPYNISESDSFLISAGTIVGNDVTNTFQDDSEPINLYNGIPLSNHVSGTDLEKTTAGNLTNWTMTGLTRVTGNNSMPTSTSIDYFPVVDYYPIYDSAEEGRLRGTFKCLISKDVGRFKFNKIALYAIQYVNGVPNSNIEFFGEAYLNEPIVKAGLSQDGFDNIILDLQIDLHSVSSTWDEVFFSSSADYWSHSPGGLYFPNKVGIGQYDNNVYEMESALHVRRTRDTSGAIDLTIPQLRLDHDNNHWVSFEVSSTAWDIPHGSQGSDLLLTGPTLFSTDSVALLPKLDMTWNLGTSASHFRSAWIKETLPLKIPLNVEHDYGTAVSINNGKILLGSPNGLLEWPTRSEYAIRVLDASISITSGADLYGSFKGGDLIRNADELLIYTTFCTYAYPYTEYKASDIVIVAGVNEQGTYTSINGQTGLTHKNLLHEFVTDLDFVTNTSNEAKLLFAGRGGLKLTAPIEISTKRNSYLYNQVTYNHYNAMIMTREPYFFIGAGLSEEILCTNWDTINRYITNATWDFCALLTTTESKLFLVAKNIITTGDIIPKLDNLDDIGTDALKYKKIYGHSMDFDWGATQISTLSTGSIYSYLMGFYFSSYIYTSSQKTAIISLLPGSSVYDKYYTNGIFSTISNIGNSSQRITNGYFDLVDTTNIQVNTLTTPNLQTQVGNITTSLGSWSTLTNIISTNIVSIDPAYYPTIQSQYCIMGKTLLLNLKLTGSLPARTVGYHENLFQIKNCFGKNINVNNLGSITTSIVDLSSVINSLQIKGSSNGSINATYLPGGQNFIVWYQSQLNNLYYYKLFTVHYDGVLDMLSFYAHPKALPTDRAISGSIYPTEMLLTFSI